jgi:hypothetical protein
VIVTKTIGFLIVLGIIGLSSWMATRRARRILSQSLGREVRAGEESSLRAWMAVPDAALSTAAEQMASNPAEQVLGAMESKVRTSAKPPQSDYPSIR